MTGHDLAEQRPEDTVAHDARPPPGVQGLGRAGYFDDVSFDVQPGEILGVTGLLGSGRTEIAEALFGVAPADSGRSPSPVGPCGSARSRRHPRGHRVRAR